MTTISPKFEINGVVSTDKSVMQNVNMLANACGSWVTYDIALGKWSVIINRAGTSIASFSDSNIIGGINITGTGVSELYNAVTIEFPHKDLRDQTDYIDYELDSALRFPNELDNKLNISLDIVNDPIQAEYIAVSELKQSRIDKVITFRTDYTNLGLKAGDLIDVTNSYYGYTSKVFRIIKMEEDDAEGLVISITALEYDADVYSTTGLTRKIREKKTGIIPKDANEALTNLDNQASLKLAVTQAAADQGLSIYYQSANKTWFLDYGGKIASIAATDVVISWTYPDGEDLDIRCFIKSPDVGQNSMNEVLGYATVIRQVWPPGSTTGSAGTAYTQWGGDNTGPGGDPTKVESVRVDIDRLKTVFPTKRYFVIECRGNWFVTRGNLPVKLTAKLYEGGTTSSTGGPLYNFTNTTATKTRTLDGVEVIVDSFYGQHFFFANVAAFPSGSTPIPGQDKSVIYVASDTGFQYRWNGSSYVITDGLNGVSFTGATVLGDFMGYFVFDTINNTGQFVNSLNPTFLT